MATMNGGSDAARVTGLEKENRDLKHANQTLRAIVQRLQARVQFFEAQHKQAGDDNEAIVPIDEFPPEIKDMVAVEAFREDEIIDCRFIKKLISKPADCETILKLVFDQRAKHLRYFLAANTFDFTALDNGWRQITIFLRSQHLHINWLKNIHSIYIFVPFHEDLRWEYPFEREYDLLRELVNLKSVTMELLQHSRYRTSEAGRTNMSRITEALADLSNLKVIFLHPMYSYTKRRPVIYPGTTEIEEGDGNLIWQVKRELEEAFGLQDRQVKVEVILEEYDEYPEGEDMEKLGSCTIRTCTCGTPGIFGEEYYE